MNALLAFLAGVIALFTPPTVVVAVAFFLAAALLGNLRRLTHCLPLPCGLHGDRADHAGDPNRNANSASSAGGTYRLAQRHDRLLSCRPDHPTGGVAYDETALKVYGLACMPAKVCSETSLTSDPHPCEAGRFYATKPGVVTDTTRSGRQTYVPQHLVNHNDVL